MKNYKLNKRKKALSILTASTVAMNMLFLPPFVSEEKFSLKKKEIIEESDDKRKAKKKKYNMLKKDLLKCKKARNSLNKPNYYINSEETLKR